MFNTELNQEFAQEFFEQVFKTKKLVRSYLFLGDNKEDKKEYAFQLAKILNCEKNKRVWLDKLGNNANQNTLFAVEEADYQNPCETCQSCEWINEKTHPKTPIFIEASGAKNTIQVETVRKLQEDLCQTSEHFRIIVFDNASNQVLNKSSSAALLKTIEEAKPNTMFLFFADSKDNVLSTIVSRCQYLQFKTTNKVAINEEIEELKNSISSFVYSQAINNELERLTMAEELAQKERTELLEALSLLQREVGAMKLDLDSAKAIFAYEELVYDLKSFVKVKAALKDCFDKLADLELGADLEFA